jgi:hypothetical protein
VERSDLITLSSFPNCDPLNSICVERWCIYLQRDWTICSRDVIYCFSFSMAPFDRWIALMTRTTFSQRWHERGGKVPFLGQFKCRWRLNVDHIAKMLMLYV